GRDGIELSDRHWLVIEILRNYFDEFGIETPMRVLVSRLKTCGGADWANSRALYRLFPEGPVRQGSRYGGLPIPLSCI
ncbi:MAG: TusE/DsrC/DsvC family sulfur relay protein, partial [Gammaproteobacteria bacterium]|nr:TusE/DsrC/DsvC family sulfur relay protein [Gammaproteobacteria bacterium]